MSHLFLSISPAVVLAMAVTAPALSESHTDRLLQRLNTAARQVTVFENVNVIPMDADRVLSNQTVVIRQGRIFEIGHEGSTSVPENAQRIDGRGKYLIPGLADMHFHLQGAEADPEEINACLLFFVANGVTTVRSTLGKPNHIEIRDKIKTGQLFGPNLYLACPSIHSKSITTVTAAREFVFQSKAEGYDLIKLHDISDSTIYDAAIQAAKQVSLPYFGHVTSEIGIDRALKASQPIEHLCGYLEALEADKNGLPALVRATRDANVWNCPTQSFYECLYERDINKVTAYEGMAYLPSTLRETWIQKKQQEIIEYAAVEEEQMRKLEVVVRLSGRSMTAGQRSCLAATRQ